MASVDVIAATKSFGKTPVLRGVDLAIADGEFLALLGPSGCGKTTLLRLIAGLERLGSGEIRIDGEVMEGPGRFVDPEDRHLGMVFQSYALWPHMSVRRNVEFGLAMRGVARPERRQRVASALAAVGLTGLEDRRPQALSGGQRQRAALARCIALSPRIILLDEPLANLDAHLRHAMQQEFRRLHRETGTTFVFVTHDQSEAMALADRVAVMDKGQLQQVGTPEALYAEPATAMVAAFVGKGALLPVAVEGRSQGGSLSITLAGHRIESRGDAAPGPGLLCLRPDDVVIVPANFPGSLPARVAEVSYRGGHYAVDLVLPALPGHRIEASMRHAPQPGEAVSLQFEGGWVLAAPDAVRAEAA
ncbi:iron(III) transport system ATP-binding protein [Devosia enhydra]|uniref:Iron(III) transport system ATP-binding protein n=1 Tax=Devosia enhydra TaxID=665118 RepID=A0A1K2HVX5_9HYPH|nr:ABC transporter ATP-binding protein [Devosia enhydra]SFZ83033.1 iron(III) transport system ATP-binding protein [Devosia enhydra]